MPPQSISQTQLEELRARCPDLDKAGETTQESPLLYLLLSTSQDDLIPYVSERSCLPGDILVREGELGDSMYLIHSGKAVVLKGHLDHPTVLDFRQSGSIIGEMALLENAPRSATVVALQPMILLQMNRTHFFELLTLYPAANQAIMSMLCARLRKADEQRNNDFLQQKQLRDQVEALATEKLILEERQAVNEKTSAIIAALREQAIRDPLTGLYNRRHMEETLERELRRAQRENGAMAVIMMDIDFFKRVNDTYGHQGGDVMLKALGSMVQRYVRGEDSICRYGGEEFAIVMPAAGLKIACERAEQIRQAFQELHVPFEGREIHTTLSLGVAAYPTHSPNSEDILLRADRALYAAKQNGRNRVVADEAIL